MDLPFVLILGGIVLFGLLMVFSASSFSAYYYKDDSFYYLKNQALYVALGSVLLYVLSKLDYKWFRVISLLAVAASVLMMVYVLHQPSKEGVSSDDIKRWVYINLGSRVFTFQPSEFAKYALILFMAYRLDDDNRKMRDNRPINLTRNSRTLYWVYEKSGGKIYISRATAMFVGYMLLICIFEYLLARESHLSGMILIMGIGVSMLWFGEGKARWFVIGGIIAVVVVIFVLANYESLDFLKEYWKERIRAWLDKGYSPKGKRWQTNQSLFAIGSGGFLGAGFGQSKEKYLYVSEPQNDFIFAIICEELGFVGAVGVLAAFAGLVLRGLYIANRAKDRFGTLLCYGIVTHIALQVFLNVAVVSDLLPNTGIGLPFISSGGTAMLINLAEMGTLLSVSRQANLPKLYSFGIIRRKKKKAQPVQADTPDNGTGEADIFEY